MTARRPKKTLGEKKYLLYENSVQSPEGDIETFQRVYSDHNDGGRAFALREDFCGTFLVSYHWVKEHAENTAMAVDIDPEPLAYGKKARLSKLKGKEKGRLSVKNCDVLSEIPGTYDIIHVGNFSYYCLSERNTLLRYFKNCRSSLNEGGVLLLESIGGSGFEEAPKREQRLVKYERGRYSGQPWFTYIWEQKSFCPATRYSSCSISFKMANGTSYRNVFTYGWRIWTLPELRDILLDAGFKDVSFYWQELDDKGRPGDDYVRAETFENIYCWICYIAASTSPGD